MNKKTRSNKSEKLRYTRTSVEIARTNEHKRFEVIVTSYGRNQNRDNKINRTKGRPITAPAIAVRLLKKQILTNIQKSLNFEVKEFSQPLNHKLSLDNLPYVQLRLFTTPMRVLNIVIA